MVFILNSLTQSLSSMASKREKATSRRHAREAREAREAKQTSHNQMDLKRDTARLSQSRGGIATETHQPIPHHRLQGHIDPKVAVAGRGGDRRDRLKNSNSVVRRMRDNDPINVDRPLG